MVAYDVENQIKQLLDAQSDLNERAGMIARLAEDGGTEALAILVRLVKADEADAAVSAASGRALAIICFRRSQDVDELVMADMAEDAYLAYDSEIARLNKLSPETRMQRGVVGSGR